MARLKNRTTARYFEKGKYVKDGLNCWTKSGADFECKVECPYNERKAECDCHTVVSKDALDYINELEAKLADVVPKSEVEFLRKTIAENAQQALEVTLEEIEKTKAEVAREIFEEIEKILPTNMTVNGVFYRIYLKDAIAELKKRYTEGE